MNKIFSGIVAAFLLISPLTAAEIEPPVKMEVTGVVVVSKTKKKLKNAAIVNDAIWWEGQTIKVRKDDDTWIILTLSKVEIVKGKGGVLTFLVEDGSNDLPTFKVAIKKASGWGLTK